MAVELRRVQIDDLTGLEVDGFTTVRFTAEGCAWAIDLGDESLKLWDDAVRQFTERARPDDSSPQERDATRVERPTPNNGWVGRDAKDLAKEAAYQRKYNSPEYAHIRARTQTVREWWRRHTDLIDRPFRAMGIIPKEVYEAFDAADGRRLAKGVFTSESEQGQLLP